MARGRPSFPGSNERLSLLTNEMEGVIFIGVQGSGKTSFYRERLFDTHVRISLDMLRTRSRERLLLAACLEARQPFVIDNTNPLRVDRARYILPARATGVPLIAYYFETTLKQAIRRNNERRGKQKIPVPAIVATARKLEPPALSEGFVAVRTVTLTESGFVVLETAS
jgi:predicted kinase